VATLHPPAQLIRRIHAHRRDPSTLTAAAPTVHPLLHRPLLFVTGKGGVGKTTVAAGLGLAAAARGRRTIVCEVGAARHVPALFDRPPGADGEEVRLGEHLWTVSVDPDRALREWLARQLGSRPFVELLSRSNAFGYFVAAAPGARELVTISKLWELGQADRWRRDARSYDLVVVDLPSSGHGVGLLRTARTFRDVARVGPVASQAGAVAQAIEDPARSGVVAVALPGELPVSETLELEGRVARELRRPLDRIVVNALLPGRWRAADLEALAAAGARVPAPAARSARSEAARTRVQRSQLARLRRHARAAVVTLPFVVAPALAERHVAALGAELARKLDSGA